MPTPELLLIGGKPYSGKTSIASSLAQTETDHVIKHLSMGDRLRGIASGKIASRYSAQLMQSSNELKAHEPVVKELPIAVFEEFIETEPSDLLMLDAFPRYPNRLDAFRDSVQRLGIRVLAVCIVSVDDATVLERSPNRPQRYADVAEDEEFINKRLADYKDSAGLVLEALSHDYPLYVLDGTQPIRPNVGRLRDIYLTHTEY